MDSAGRTRRKTGITTVGAVRTGFTTIELIVSVLMISIIMAGALPTLSVLRSSKDLAVEIQEASDRVAVSQGVVVYSILFGEVPKDLGELMSSGIVIGDPRSPDGSLYDLEYKKDGTVELVKE